MQKAHAAVVSDQDLPGVLFLALNAIPSIDQHKDSVLSLPSYRGANKMRNHWRQEKYVKIVDAQGLRHLVRVGHINSLSDTDPLQNETCVKLGTQFIHVSEPLDSLANRILRDDEDFDL
jgi:hypothetical protein